VFQEITQGAEIIKVGSPELPARAYVSSFNIRGTDQQKLVGALSGGERNRVNLAKLLQSGGNVLLLDKPTNDLDVDTLRALEAGLEQRSTNRGLGHLRITRLLGRCRPAD
jgi:sulfate-transporting ATPase